MLTNAPVLKINNSYPAQFNFFLKYCNLREVVAVSFVSTIKRFIAALTSGMAEELSQCWLATRHTGNARDCAVTFQLALLVLLTTEKYFEMNKKNCKEALDVYKKFLARMDRVCEFLKVAEVRILTVFFCLFSYF